MLSNQRSIPTRAAVTPLLSVADIISPIVHPFLEATVIILIHGGSKVIHLSWDISIHLKIRGWLKSTIDTIPRPRQIFTMISSPIVTHKISLPAIKNWAHLTVIVSDLALATILKPPGGNMSIEVVWIFITTIFISIIKISAMLWLKPHLWSNPSTIFLRTSWDYLSPSGIKLSLWLYEYSAFYPCFAITADTDPDQEIICQT